MQSEGNAFVKGMLYGGLFCLVLSLFVSFWPMAQAPAESHLHHHVKAPSKEELSRMPNSWKLEASRSLRVYCAVMVQPKLLLHWVTTKETWSKHCDQSVFYTSESSKAMEDGVDLQEPNEWLRIRKALTHAYDNAGDLRWFFLVQPTTFAIIENLKFLLLNRDPGQPFYMGRSSKTGELEYVELASGVVLSYEALGRLVKAFGDEEKCPQGGHSLWKLSVEMELATCLRLTGVFAENGEDAQGKSLFNSKSPQALISDSMANAPADVIEGCCSDMAVTYAGMSPSQMHVMMYGVYRLRPYGHDFHDFLMFLPPKDSDDD